MRKRKIWIYMILVGLVFFITPRLIAGDGIESSPPPGEMKKKILQFMKEGKIPGLSLVMVKGNEKPIIQGYGSSDLEKKSAVTSRTLFELASCSKAFTALAVLQLAENGSIRLDDPVSKYFPWFYATHKHKKYKITIRQLLHHTSGIPWRSISRIPEGNQKDALQQTLRNIAGIKLNNIPGKHYTYATVNYDIAGAIIEKVSGRNFEEYMRDNVFLPLDLTRTTVGMEENNPHQAAGYKIGFFSPRRYVSPAFRGNNPAAYIVSNGEDMAKWLQLQMGIIDSEFKPLIQKTHVPDQSVLPFNLKSYGMGWVINQYRRSAIVHSGANPNFTAFIGFYPEEKIGVAIMANSNSTYTTSIGNYILRSSAGESDVEISPPTNKIDTICSIFSFVLGLYILVIIGVIIYKLIDFFRGKKKLAPLTWKKIGKIFAAVLFSIPYLYGIYLIPRAATNLSWDAALVWAPTSFYIAVLLLVLAIGVNYVLYFISLIFPSRNKYTHELPTIIIIGILAGMANTAVLLLVTTSFFSSVGLFYLLYYFGMAYSLNIFGRKIVQTKMINISNGVTLDLRVGLLSKLLSTRYQQFEKLHDGRIFTTLNGDTAVLAGSAGLFVNIITNSITAFSAFIYLASISLFSTGVVLFVVITMVFYNSEVSKRARVFMEKARDTANVYMNLLNNLIRGYKELSLHRDKKREYKEDLIQSCKDFRKSNIISRTKFVNSSLIGDSFVMIIIGVLSIVVPRVITSVNVLTLIGFIMVLLYLIGPINALMRAIPSLTGLRVSWNRIQELVRDLEITDKKESVKEFVKNIDLRVKSHEIDRNIPYYKKEPVKSINVEGIRFEYQSEDESERFAIGPIDFEVNSGETLFIVGGNGSGKTTLANVLTGLYVPDDGTIRINGREVTNSQLGENYSTVFSNYHLFRKLYNINAAEKEPEIQRYLKLLRMEEKVKLVGKTYSRIELSGGQRKRLALFQCYLEDRPIFLFDELAADQDPEFRRFFYRDLLVQMKKEGKIVIAITHDDHYFDVADKIMKLDMGKIDFLKTQSNQNGQGEPLC
jgi:putative ATP-binding cassette transporter